MKGFKQPPAKKLQEMSFEDLHMRDGRKWLPQLFVKNVTKIASHRQQEESVGRGNHGTYTRT